MKPWLALPFLFCLGLSIAGHAATETEMQAGKTMGQSIGIAGAASNPLNGASTTFSTVSGGGGYSSLGEPANGGTAGAKANNTYSFTVDCNVTRTKYLGGIGTKNGTCSLDANANVAAIPFSVCTRSQAGAICGSGDWSSMQSVNKGQSATLAGGKVSIKVVSCAYNTCQATLTDNDSASGTGATLNQQGQQMSASEGGDSLIGAQTTAYNNPAFHSALRSSSTQANCYSNNVAQALDGDGTVKTCDGKQSVSVAPGCKTVTECLAQQTSTRTWTESCEAEVPLTTKTCSTVTPSVDCSESLPTQQYTCSKTLSVAVTGTATTAPCTGRKGSIAYNCYYGACDYSFLDCTATPGVYVVTTYDNFRYGSCSASKTVAANAGQVSVFCGPSNNSHGVTSSVSCNGTNCTWSGTNYVNVYTQGYFNIGFQGSGSAITYSYTDTWNNGCSVYDAAP